MSRSFPLFLLVLPFSLLSLPSLGQDLKFSLEIANPNPVGSGARAMGQANAFIAIADDATAASWNPAGLLQLEKPEISFALESLYLRSEVNSPAHPESERSDSLSLEDFNYASLVYPFEFGTNMVVSLNYLKLFRFDKETRIPISQLTTNPVLGTSERNLIYDFDQDGSFSVLSPAFGVDVTDKLSLGVSLNIWSHDITQSSKFEKKEVTTGSQTFSNLPGFEQPLKFIEENTIEVDEGYSVVIGGLYWLNEQWNLGFVIKPGFDLNLDHKRTEDEKPSEQVDSELEMPWIIGAGVAWRPYDPLSLSLDLTWTDWSGYTFKENDVVKNPLTSRPASVDELEDTFTARVGGEYLLVRDHFIVPFRCGFGYDPAPAVDDVDDFYTLNFGTGIQLGRYNFDVAYEFRWGNDVNRHFLETLDSNSTQDVRRHRVLASLIYYF